MTGLTTILALIVGFLAPRARAEPARYTGWLVAMPTTLRHGATEQIPATMPKPPGDGPFAGGGSFDTLAYAGALRMRII